VTQCSETHTTVKEKDCISLRRFYSRPMSDRKTVPMSLRLSPELITRLEECAESLRMKKHTLAQEAIEAAVDAIEKNGYRLVVPIEFEVSHVPTKKPEQPVSYSRRESEPPTVLNEPNSPATKEGTAESVLDSLTKDIGKRGKRSGGSQKPRQ
jgi:predicted DNA-binding protein